MSKNKPKVTLLRFSLERRGEPPENTAPVTRLPRRKVDRTGRPVPGTGMDDWIPTGWTETYDRPINRRFRRSMKQKHDD